MIRGVANLLPIGREGIVVLPAEREWRHIVIPGCEIATRAALSRNDQKMISLPCLVRIPVAIEQMSKNQRLDLRLLHFLHPFRVAGLIRALGIDMRNKKNVLAIRRPERTIGFRSN